MRRSELIRHGGFWTLPEASELLPAPLIAAWQNARVYTECRTRRLGGIRPRIPAYFPLCCGNPNNARAPLPLMAEAGPLRDAAFSKQMFTSLIATACTAAPQYDRISLMHAGPDRGENHQQRRPTTEQS